MHNRDIKLQKLLYHLTAVKNLPSIFSHGLLPRSDLEGFFDVADGEIIQKRQIHGLHKYVPFHWFARNPFDGVVQASRPNEDFALITVHRDLASAENWKVIPRHPLASEAPRILDYADGFSAIEWDLMNLRDYRNPDSKSVCMAECLSFGVVHPSKFYAVYVPTQELADKISGCSGVTKIEVNQYMFNR